MSLDIPQLENQFRLHKGLFFIVLLMLVGSISLIGLNGSIQNVDESKYTTISRETLEAGSLIPVRDGEYHVHKSPIVYWTAMVSFKIFGVNDFAAKFPSALANMISAIIIFLLVNMIFQSYSSGFMAVFIYLTSLQVYGSSHQIAADSIMVMTILTSLYFSLKAIHEKKGWILVAAFCNALTILTKSVLGLAVPAALLVYIIIQKKWSQLFYLIIFAVTSFSIALPYFIYTYKKAPEIFIETFLKRNLMNRIIADDPFSFSRILNVFRNGIVYILFLLVFILPFTPVVYHLFRRKDMETSLREVIWNSHSKMISIYFVIIWCMFSIGKKLYPHYTLSVIPVLAIYLGDTLGKVKDKRIFLHLAGFSFFALICFSIFVALEMDRYPTYRDVVFGLYIMYALFIGINIALYFYRGNTNVKLLLLTFIYFITFTITTATTVPLDFNADIKSFKEIIYNEQETLVVINTKEVNEGRYKRGATKWYLRMDAKQYRTLDMFIPDTEQYRRDTYFIYYYKYTDQLQQTYDSFQVLKRGKIWNLGVTR